MDKRERVEAALTGKKLDRVPVSAWGHFFNKEVTVDGFVSSMLDFQEHYDWDYMKMQARYTYHFEDWGAVVTQSGRPGDWPVIEKLPVTRPEDWTRLRIQKPREGVLGSMIHAAEGIRVGLGGKTPCIMTVFSPLMIAHMMAGDTTGTLLRHLREERESLKAGMEVIAETFRLFVAELRKTGIDGIFYATKQANDDFMGAAEYQAFARPYDEQVLSAAKGFPFVMLHLCMDKIHLKEMADYPVTMVHWDPTLKGNPSYTEARALTGDRVALGGGPSRPTLAQGSPAELKGELKTILTDAGDRHFLLGPGCSVLIAETLEENLRILRNAPEEYQDY